MRNNNYKLIINADDFGYSPGVTAGILYAHKQGVVTSTTAIVNSSFAKEAIYLAESYPKLGIGLHFVLDIGQPVLPYVHSLTDSNGMFLKGERLMNSARKKDVKAELKAQLSLLLSWNIEVTHIDSHHHMHINIPAAQEAVTEVAREYNLPVRSLNSNQLPEDIVKNNSFLKEFYGDDRISVSSLIHMLTNMKEGVTEMLCHPAFMDCWLYEGSSYSMARIKELQTLVDEKLSAWLRDQNIKLINYGDFQKKSIGSDNS